MAWADQCRELSPLEQQALQAVNNLIYRLETTQASSETKELLDAAATALASMCAELQTLRDDWTRLKVLYELDTPAPWVSGFKPREIQWCDQG